MRENQQLVKNNELLMEEKKQLIKDKEWLQQQVLMEARQEVIPTLQGYIFDYFSDSRCHLRGI